MKTVVYLSIIIYILLFLTYTFFSQKEKQKEKEKQDDTKNTNKNENNKILIHIAWFISGFSIFLLALSNIQYPDLHIGEFTVKLLGLYGFLAFIVLEF